MYLRIRPSELELKVRSLDTEFWVSVLGKYKSIQTKLPRRSDRVIGADLFNLLYQWEPELREAKLDPALRAWLENKIQSPDLNALRSDTVGDKEKSAFAAVKLWQELHRPRNSQMKSVSEGYNNLRMLKALGADQKLIDQMEQLQEAVGEAVSEGDEGFSQAVSTVQQDIESLGEFSDILGGHDLNSQDRFLELGLDEQLMATIKNQKTFRDVMKALGRIRLLAGKIKSRKPKPSPEPVGLTVGGELSSVVPSEYVSLGDEDLETLFLAKLHDRQLVQYKRQRKQVEGRGPIIVCHDVSGSMGGIKDINAKAMFLQLCRTAVEQRRKVAWIPFATYAGEPIFVEGYQDLLKVITPQRWAGLGGGTNFNPPLTRCMDIVRDEGIYRNADIIFMTDGESYVEDEVALRVMEFKTETGARIMGALFSGHWYGDMTRVLDVSVSVDNAAKIEWTEEILEQVI